MQRQPQLRRVGVLRISVEVGAQRVDADPGDALPPGVDYPEPPVLLLFVHCKSAEKVRKRLGKMRE